MTGHVGSETIAAFRENLLPARDAASIAEHLSSCPQCAEVDAQLGAVTTILASTPAPPMPASVATRLDAALAAEIARAAAAPPPGIVPAPAAGSPPGTVPPPAPISAAASPAGTDPGADAGPTAGPPAKAAAAEGAAAPAGAPVPGGLRARPAGGAGTAPGHAGRAGTGPGHAAAGPRPGRSRARPWRSLRVTAAAATVVLLGGVGYAISQSLPTGGSSVSASSPAPAAAPRASTGGLASGEAPAAAPRAPATAGLPLVASRTDYRAGQLAAQVGAVLKRYPPFAPSPKAAPAVSTAAFPHLAACVSGLAGGRHPRLVDIARYGTRPAAVIVVPAAGTSAMRVWVVGTGCAAQGGDVIARLSVPAPG